MAEKQRLAPSERIGYAVVGLGDYAVKQILPAFGECERSRLVALVSGDKAKARRIGREYGVAEERVYSYDTFEQLADAADIDAVYIILPNALHAPYTARAARAGKHVLCEKPIAVSSNEAEAMIAACADAGRKLMIGYRAHWEPHNVAAHKLLREGAIGQLKLIVADHIRPLDPREPQDRWRTQRELAGGGALVDIGIYSLNAARWFSGEEPVAVQATSWSTPGDKRFREVEEATSFVLRFPGGILANCLAGYGAARTKRYRLLGTEGYLDLDPATEYAGNRLVLGTETTREEQIVEPGSQFARQIDHFSDCIRNNTAPDTPGEMGLQDQRLIEHIYQAARSGETVELQSNVRSR